MKNIKLFLFFLLGANSLFSQKQFRIEYQANHNIIHGGYNGTNTLYVQGDESIFIHNDYPAKNELVETKNGFQFTIGDPEGMPIYINQNLHKLTYKSDGGFTFKGIQGLYIFEDSLPKINWEIISDSNKMVGSYLCTFAFGEFGGRRYNCWFSYEIPILSGPHKLNGLPGLIMEAKSLDGMVFWSIKNLKVIKFGENEYQQIEKPQKGYKMTKDNHKELVLMHKEKIESSPDLPSGTVLSISNPNPNLEIEKGIFNYIKY